MQHATDSTIEMSNCKLYEQLAHIYEKSQSLRRGLRYSVRSE